MTADSARFTPRRFHPLGDSWLLEWTAASADADGPLLHLDATPSMPHRVMLSRERMEKLVAGHAIRDPALLIFHVSHCGSTLLARLLAADPRLHVCLEPDFIGRFLAQTYTWSRQRFSRAAETMIRACALGVPEGRRLVVKFPSHALHRLDAIRECFPAVPVVLVYREPSRVMAGSMSEPSGFLSRRPAWLLKILGLDVDVAASMSAEVLCEVYLQRLYSLAAQHIDRFDRVINYVDLPGVLDDIRAGTLRLPELNIAQAARDVAEHDSKDPRRAFIPRRDASSASAISLARRAEAGWLMPQYEVLESRRLARHESCLTRVP